MVPKTRLAMWAEERIIALTPDVRLMRTYNLVSEISGSPDYFKGIIFAGDKNGTLYAIDTESKTETYIKNKAILGVNITSDIKYYKNFVFAGTEDGRFFCFDQNLNILWQFKAYDSITGTPIADGTTVYFSSKDGNIYAVNINSGKLLWNYNSGSSIASLIMDKNYLYFANNSGEVNKINLVGNHIWQFNALGNISGALALNRDFLAFGTDRGVFYLLNKENGNVSKKLIVEFPIYSGILETEKNYFFGAGNIFYALDNIGNIKWKFIANSAIKSMPEIREKVIIFSEENGVVYSLNTDGVQNWKYIWESPIYTKPLLISQNSSFIGAKDGSILELYFKK